MKNIDFLPQEYRQQHAKRSVQVWRVVVVAVFVVMLCVASLLQYYRLCRTKGQVAQLALEKAAAESQNRQLERIRTECRKVTGDAELFTYLRHPWPRTQILAALLAPLPESATLTQLEIKADDAQGPRRRVAPSVEQGKHAEGATETTLPAGRDLAALRQQWDTSRVTAVLTGETADAAALHQYLSTLGRCSLFVKAELDKLQIMASDETGVPEGTMSFTAVVTIRPGYGQPDGPTGSPRGEDAASPSVARSAEELTRSESSHVEPGGVELPRRRGGDRS